MKISRNDFIKYLKRFLEYKTREDHLCDALSDYCEDFWIYHPKDIESLIIDLLIELTGDNKEDSIIEYWMYELDAGKSWQPNTITDENGNDIKLQTSNDLYDYLVKYDERKRLKC